MEPFPDGPEEESAVLPLTSDFGPAGFQPYALDLVGLGLASDESPLVLAYVVMTRRDGFLLCLPELALPLEVLQGGNEAAPQDLVGPSLKVEVQCAVLDEDAILQMPSPLEGRTMSVLLVDFASAALACLQAVKDRQKLESLSSFDMLDISVVPDPDDVVTRANAWAQGLGGDQLERIQYYSADEVPETPLAPQAKRATRRKGPGAGTGGGTTARRPTVASLAESIEALTQTLPAISEKLQELTLRQEAMEAGALRPPERASALRKPLGSSPTIGLTGASMGPAGLLQQMPPPKSTTSQAKTPRVSFSKAEAAEIASEAPPEGMDLTQAVLEQSRALTSLVAHLAANSSDPFSDLSSSSSALSSKGAIGRAKLQSELAAHKGVFFNSVIQSMARRMQPALPSEVELSVLRDRGVSPTQYLERFGGFGRCKDIGFIIWQVAMCLNHMMEENHAAARDSLSLLFVCLEQTAMDSGNMQVGLLLSLQEDPPQSLFTNRSIASAALPRAFAPTAHQRWVTTALQFLKEMDIITSKRAEVAGGKLGGDKGAASSSTMDAGSTQTPKRKAKAKPGGKGQKNQAQQQVEEEV